MHTTSDEYVEYTCLFHTVKDPNVSFIHTQRTLMIS